MLYALVFILLIILILLVTVIRMIMISRQRRKASRSGTGPALPPAPRFTQVAREVSYNWFGSSPGVGPANAGMRGYQPRYTSGVHPSERQGRGEVVRDERDPEMGDPELPSYYDSSTLPHPPAAVYNSPIQARRDGRSTTSIPPPTHDGAEPPKYDIVTRL